MDLITQGVLGAAIGQAGWSKTLGRRAILVGALCGIAPDLDVLAAIGGEWASLVHHRGLTHALIFAPLVALPLGKLIHKLTKQGDWKQWAHLAFWALWTHPLLDVFTTYGTQLAIPFSDRRFAIDGVSIIDPIYTLPLIAALVLGRVWRARPERVRKLAAGALLFTTAYLGLGLSQASQARDAARDDLRRAGVKQPLQVRAMPTMANIWAWRVVARDDDERLFIGQRSNLAPKPIQFATLTRPDHPLIDKALEDERAQIFRWFAMDLISYEVSEVSDGWLVTMHDQRYGGMRDPTKSMWGAQARFDADGTLRDVTRTSPSRGELGPELRALWRLITTGRAVALPPEGRDAQPSAAREEIALDASAGR